MSPSIRIAILLGLCTAFVPAHAGAQARFEAVDASGIAGVPGLRIISVHDNLRHRCYLAFVSESAPSDGAPAPDVDAAAAAADRDRALADLARSYETAANAYAGNINPNALLYESQGETIQITFALAMIRSMLARLEQEVDRAAGRSGVALAVMPDVCAPGEARATPP